MLGSNPYNLRCCHMSCISYIERTHIHSTCTHAHTHTRAHTHTHVHTRVHTYTCTHIHIHTQSSSHSDLTSVIMVRVQTKLEQDSSTIHFRHTLHHLSSKFVKRYVITFCSPNVVATCYHHHSPSNCLIAADLG